jgi:hypothetical protein
MNPCPKHPENSYLTNFHMSTNLARTGNNENFMRIERLEKLNSVLNQFRRATEGNSELESIKQGLSNAFLACV